MLDRLPEGVLARVLDLLPDATDRALAAVAAGLGRAVALPAVAATARAGALAAALGSGAVGGADVESLDLSCRSAALGLSPVVAIADVLSRLPRLRRLALRTCPKDGLLAAARALEALDAPLEWLRVELFPYDADYRINVGPVVERLRHLLELEFVVSDLEHGASGVKFDPVETVPLHRLYGVGVEISDFHKLPELRALSQSDWESSLANIYGMASALEALPRLRVLDLTDDSDLLERQALSHGGVTAVGISTRTDLSWARWSFPAATDVYSLPGDDGVDSFATEVGAETARRIFPALRRVHLVRNPVNPSREPWAARLAARLGVEAHDCPMGEDDEWYHWFQRVAGGFRFPPEFRRACWE